MSNRQMQQSLDNQLAGANQLGGILGALDPRSPGVETRGSGLLTQILEGYADGNRKTTEIISEMYIVLENIVGPIPRADTPKSGDTHLHIAALRERVEDQHANVADLYRLLEVLNNLI